MGRDGKKNYIFLGFLVIPVIWGVLLFTPYTKRGLFFVLSNSNGAINDPFRIVWVSDIPRVALIFVLAYLVGIGIYISNIKNYRKKEKYRSTRWGDNSKINKRYTSTRLLENRLLMQNVCIGLDGKKHQRNLSTIVLGGSGASKTRFYVKPNILQCNTSFVILDPKGGILRDTGYLLEEEGYVIKVIDLVNMLKSHCCNPFAYIKDDKDILKLITNLVRNTTPKGSRTNDPFWEKSKTALLEALCLYSIHGTPEEKQNFIMVMEMIASANVEEDDREHQSPLDKSSDRLEV